MSIKEPEAEKFKNLLKVFIIKRTLERKYKLLIKTLNGGNKEVNPSFGRGFFNPTVVVAIFYSR
jgi:hypothetical protein